MDIAVIGIRDASTEKERLLLLVKRDCDLYGYMVLDNTFNSNGSLSNTNRHVFIFPKYDVQEGDIIRLYTKQGNQHSAEGTFKREKVMYHNFYWNFDEGCTVWNQLGDRPYLVHFDESMPLQIV